MPPPDATAAAATGLQADAEVQIVDFAYQGHRYTARVNRCPQARTEPLLIIGGVLQSKDTWRLHEMDIGAWATTVVIEVPGFGDADPLPVHHGLDFLATAVRHALRTMAMPSVNVLGHSYGSLIGYQLACDYPDQVARLALAGLGKSDPEQLHNQVEEVAQLLKEGDWDAIAHRAVEAITRTPDNSRTAGSAALDMLVRRQFNAMPVPKVKQYLANLERLLYANEHHGLWTTSPVGETRLTTPTLLFTGAGDTMAPPDDIRSLAESFADARFTTIRDSGHLAPFERRNECIDLLRRFFTDELSQTPEYCSAIERSGP
ncbi:alpha/beta fold hydrolase [Streptomyces sp. NPDC057743]|uniref:alpha/beta fold hydrolase n=1 Tax=Streptomyces sp. NPDC057743 TaxID=3346236 RepID=UPI0036810F5C